MSWNVHFDWLAPLYDRVVGRPEELPLRDHLKLPTDGWLLDAGGGTGRISQALQGDVGKAVLLDVSVPMLKQARDKEDCCLPVAGRSESPPFPTACFDRIIVVDAYHHLADQPASVERLWHLLNPGGRLIIEEPDIHHWGVKLVALVEKIALMRSHFMPAEEIALLFRELGAKVKLEREGYTVWVIVDKDPPEQ